MSSDKQPEVSTKKLLETADSKALASQPSTGKDGERDQSEFDNESDETREEYIWKISKGEEETVILKTKTRVITSQYMKMKMAAKERQMIKIRTRKGLNRKTLYLNQPRRSKV